MHFGLGFVLLCRRFRPCWVSKALYKLNITRNCITAVITQCRFSFYAAEKTCHSIHHLQLAAVIPQISKILCIVNKNIRRKAVYTIGFCSPSISK